MEDPDLAPRNVVIGQKVTSDKIQKAKELRGRMTEEERLLWEQLRANRLGGYHFRRQQVILGFIVDFYCHAHGLVVEVDGPIHCDQAEGDAERDRVLSENGFSVLRVTNEDVRKHLAGVLARIAAMLSQIDDGS